jgi:hypothetical protein
MGRLLIPPNEYRMKIHGVNEAVVFRYQVLALELRQKAIEGAEK